MEERNGSVDIAVSLGFSVIGLVLEYLRNAGVDEATIEMNWEATKQKLASRPAFDLPEV